ncbi:hypothetical protein PV325_008178, partial [Microctonus aethiopoides]
LNKLEFIFARSHEPRAAWIPVAGYIEDDDNPLFDAEQSYSHKHRLLGRTTTSVLKLRLGHCVPKISPSLRNLDSHSHYLKDVISFDASADNNDDDNDDDDDDDEHDDAAAVAAV